MAEKKAASKSNKKLGRPMGTGDKLVCRMTFVHSQELDDALNRYRDTVPHQPTTSAIVRDIVTRYLKEQGLL